MTPEGGRAPLPALPSRPEVSREREKNPMTSTEVRRMSPEIGTLAESPPPARRLFREL
jgi:hypothetical protein